MGTRLTPEEATAFGPYFDQEEPQAPISGIVADHDISPSYELDAAAVFKAVPKGYLVVHVSGCSCWPDRGSTTQEVCPRIADVERVLRDLGDYADLLQKCQDVEWKARKSGG